MSKVARLHTIGYQQRTGSDLITELANARVQFLVDVRATPMSRKPDFRKSRLISLLGAAGIRYVGMPGLGTPKFLRDKLARDGDYEEFFERFRTHLDSVEAHLSSLARLIERKRISLMCFERDPSECHRSAIAERIAQMLTTPVLHL